MRIDLPKEITEELPTLEDKDISEAIIYILSAPHHTQVLIQAKRHGDFSMFNKSIISF